MSSKISALASATSIANADLLTCVASGVNKKMTRPQLLTSVGSENLILTGANGSLNLAGSGSNNLTVGSSGRFDVFLAGSTVLSLVQGGTITLAAETSQSVVVSANTGSVTVNGSGAIAITPASGQTVFIGGFAGSSSDWSGDPTDVWSAIYRLAAAVAAGTTGPIA